MGTIKELNAMCVSKGAEAGAYHLTMPSIIFPIQLFIPLLRIVSNSNQLSCTAQDCGWYKLGIKRYNEIFIGSALAF